MTAPAATTVTVPANAANAPQARVELTRRGPERPWLGQLVPIDVDVWRPKGDLTLEPFSLDDVVAAGMIAKWTEHAPPPDERDADGTHFLVQHRTLFVFPQSDGHLSIPPVVARWTDPVTKKPVAARGHELGFDAAIPPGNDDALPLVASSVTFEQTFDRDLSGLRVGDGFTRTLVLRATDSDPVVFPELSLADVPGLGTYPGVSRAESSTERGEIHASQTLRVTYVVERVGRHAMSGASVRWLEPRSGHFASATLPDVVLWSAPNPSLGFQCLGIARGAALATEASSLVLVALLVLAVVRRVRRGPGRFEKALTRRSRERHAFRAVLDAGKNGSGYAALERLYAWLAVRFPKSLDRTLEPLERVDEDVRAACNSFKYELFAREKAGIPDPSFVAMLRRARNAMGLVRPEAALEDLNPRSAEKGELG